MLLTCRTCQFDGDCEKQSSVKQSVKGLGITSYKIKCKEKVEAFQRGEPVTFSANVGDGYGGDEWVRFNAIIIKKSPYGLKYLLYCVPDSSSICGEYTFEARKNGFCNISMSRILNRDGDFHSFCPKNDYCDYISDIKEHDKCCTQEAGYLDESLIPF